MNDIDKNETLGFNYHFSLVYHCNVEITITMSLYFVTRKFETDMLKFKFLFHKLVTMLYINAIRKSITIDALDRKNENNDFIIYQYQQKIKSLIIVFLAKLSRFVYWNDFSVRSDNIVTERK